MVNQRRAISEEQEGAIGETRHTYHHYMNDLEEPRWYQLSEHLIPVVLAGQVVKASTNGIEREPNGPDELISALPPIFDIPGDS